MQGTTEATTSDVGRGQGRDRQDPPARQGVDLSKWLEDRNDRLVENWMHELRAREVANGDDPVVELFATRIVEMLPVMVGPYRDQIQSQWDRTAELYGAFAAKRGLAAGEAIDELHVLRELVIRELYRDPPGNCDVPLMLREFLRLNRSLDRAVTHTSVGHTDALFFEFFEGDGVAPPVLSQEFRAEAREQLAEVYGEVTDILRQAPWNAASGARGN